MAKQQEALPNSGNLPGYVQSFPLSFKWNWHLLGTHSNTHILYNQPRRHAISKPICTCSWNSIEGFIFSPIQPNIHPTTFHLNQHTHTLITSVCQMKAVIRPERHIQCKANGSCALRENCYGIGKIVLQYRDKRSIILIIAKRLKKFNWNIFFQIK